MNLKNYIPKKTELTEMDRLFLSQLNDLIKTCSESFENFEYNKVKIEIENFFWRYFCDNYLEIIKNRVYKAFMG